jgi:hypothetical protein
MPIHPRWDEFESRLADLANGEFKLFGEAKLRQWLRDNAKENIRIAKRLHRQRSQGFFRAVADAEKCLSMLYILEETAEEEEAA